ncbi:hypothetical protein [Devosia sp. 1566]|uniref:hypothetical protein n=1 Tax=Devosia sp. 1566 TaxID=2499144 RepID=UPI000FDAD233|nr:hypothetical protein [Devosia sp. 1566]
MTQRMRLLPVSCAVLWKGLITFSLIFGACFLLALGGAKSIPLVRMFPLGADHPQIWLGSFFDRYPGSELQVHDRMYGEGAGPLLLRRGNQPLLALAHFTKADADYAVYQVTAGDLACIEHNCTPVRSGSYLVARSRDGLTSWTTQNAVMVGMTSRAPGEVAFRTSGDFEVIVVDDRVTRLDVFSAKAGEATRASFQQFGQWSRIRIAYALAFSVAAALLGTWLLLSGRWRSVVCLFTQQKLFAFAATLLFGGTYLLVFPALIISDLIIWRVSGDSFTTWFSGAYVVYLYLFNFIGYDLIQLPAVLLVFLTVLYLGQQLKTAYPQRGKLVSTLMLAGIGLSPLLFVLTYSVQRYFLAGLLAMAGLAILFSGLRPVLLERRLGFGAALGLSVIGVAALLRTEYVLILVVAFILIACSLWQGRHWSGLRSLGAIVIATGIAAFGLNMALPLAHGVNLPRERSLYLLSSLVDVARPYAGCREQPGRLQGVIAKFGPVNELCEKGAEQFFWSHEGRLSDEAAASLARELRSGVIAAVLADPTATLVRIFNRGKRLGSDQIWQIYDKYEVRENQPNIGAAVPTADNFGLVHDLPLLERAHRAMIALYKALSHTSALMIASLMLIGLSFALVRRAPLAAAVSLSILVITLANTALSPTVNWAYILILPVWGTLLPACLALELALAREQSRLRTLVLTPQPVGA